MSKKLELKEELTLKEPRIGEIQIMGGQSGHFEIKINDKSLLKTFKLNHQCDTVYASNHNLKIGDTRNNGM